MGFDHISYLFRILNEVDFPEFIFVSRAPAHPGPRPRLSHTVEGHAQLLSLFGARLALFFPPFPARLESRLVSVRSEAFRDHCGQTGREYSFKRATGKFEPLLNLHRP